MWSQLRKIQSLTHDRLQAAAAQARELAKEVMTDESVDEDREEREAQQVEDEMMHALQQRAQPAHHQQPSQQQNGTGNVASPSPSPSSSSHAPHHFSYTPVLKPLMVTPSLSVSAGGLHDDDEQKEEVEIIDDSHMRTRSSSPSLPAAAAPLPAASPPLSVFSPASTSPSSLPTISLRDSSPASFFTPPILSAATSLASVGSPAQLSERRLRAAMEEQEQQLAAYRQELATLRQQLMASQDQHDGAAHQYQHVIRQQQQHIDVMQRDAANSASASFDHPASAIADSLQALHEVSVLQQRLAEAEQSRREEARALEDALLDMRTEREAALRQCEEEKRRREVEEQTVSDLHEQMQMLQQQVRDADAQHRRLQAELQEAKAGRRHSAAADEEEEREAATRRLRDQYESEIEQLRRDLMIATSQLSLQRGSQQSPQPAPATAADSLPSSSLSSTSSSAAVQAQLSSLQRELAESSALTSSLRESNAKLTSELKQALAVKAAMVQWKEQAQTVMGKWKKEREEREAKLKDARRKLRAAEQDREKTEAERKDEAERREQEVQTGRRRADEAEEAREHAWQQEREQWRARIAELEREAARLRDEHGRERAEMEATLRSELSHSEEEKRRMREQLMELQRERESLEAECSRWEAEAERLGRQGEEDITRLQKETEQLQSASSQAAHQAADDELVARLQREAEDSRAQLHRAEAELQSLTAQLRSSQQETERLKEDSEQRQEQCSSLRQQLDSLAQQLETAKQPQPAASSAAQSSSDAKVKELQGLLKQAREGYEALSRRFGAVQAECRQLMRKDEDSAARLAVLTAELSKLRSGSGDDVDAQLSEQALTERLQQLHFEMDGKTRECEEWKRNCAAANAELQSVRQQLEQRKAQDGRDDKLQSLRHQVRQLTLDAAAVESLAQDLSALRGEAARRDREKATMTAEVERLMRLVDVESEGRERDRLQREKELQELRSRAEAGQQAAEQVEQLSRELSLLNRQLDAVRCELVASQRQARAVSEEKEQLRRGMEETMARLQRFHSTDDGNAVDRRLVVKLLVTFFERGQQQEVLDVMFRILGFTADDRRRVESGRGGGGGIGGRLLSLASFLSPFDAEKVRLPRRVEEASLADLWVDFLLVEAEKEEGGKGRPAKRSGAIYEAIASPAADAFTTPQSHRSSTAAAAAAAHSAAASAPPRSSTPQQQQQPAPAASPAARPFASTPQPVSRPPVPINPQPITLPPHLRPPFPLASRHAPLPAFSLPSHPLLSQPLPRLPLPGLPVSTAVARPVSPVVRGAAEGGGDAAVPAAGGRFGSISPVPITPGFLNTPQPLQLQPQADRLSPVPSSS